MIKEDDLYFEPFTEHFTRGFRVEEVLFSGKSKYQTIEIISNSLLGKVLFLDGKIQSAQVDEFVYHESLVHPSMVASPDPRRVLILGGGEGATLREVLRHDSVERAVMVDIDRDLVEICREQLPEWSAGAFEDSKTDLVFGDAREYVRGEGRAFDVIVSDLTEPVESGPSVHLFTREFFQDVSRILSEDGVFVLQAGSADNKCYDFFASNAATLREVFPVVRPMWVFMFSFSLPWGFVMASKKTDPLGLDEGEISKRMRDRCVSGLKCYSPGYHRGMFSLPVYLKEGLDRGRVLTDAEPFIWEA